MERNSSIFSSNKLPTAFILSAIIFLVLHTMVVRSDSFWLLFDRYTLPLVDDGFRFNATLRRSKVEKKGVSVFLIGSSQTREGFDTGLINSELGDLGVSVFSLGISGGGSPLEMYMLLDDILSHSPDIIIYTTFIGSFYGRYSYRKMPYYFDPVVLSYMLEHIDLSELFKHKREFLDSFYGLFSPMFKYRITLKRSTGLMIKSWLLSDFRFRRVSYAYSKNMPETYFTSKIHDAKGKKYVPSPYSELNYDIFLDLAGRISGISSKFVVLMGPTHPLIHECYDNELDATLSEFLQRWSKELGYTYIPSTDLPLFGPEDFIDFSHLNSIGRRKLSLFLVDFFKNTQDIKPEHDSKENNERRGSNGDG